MITIRVKGDPAVQGSGETLTWDWNAASPLESLGYTSVTSPSVSACVFSAASNVWTGASQILSGSPTISGSLISHVVTGLASGSEYRFWVKFTTNNSNIIQIVDYFECPEDS